MFVIYEAIVSNYKKGVKKRYQELTKGKTALKQNTQLLAKHNLKDRPTYSGMPSAKKLPTNQVPTSKSIKYDEIPIKTMAQRENDKIQPVVQVQRKINAQRQAAPIQTPPTLPLPIQQPHKSQKKQPIPSSYDDKQIRSTQPHQQMPASQHSTVVLFECPEGCSRSFNKNALQKHKKVCKKVFQQKRKQFCAAQQRFTEQIKQAAKNTKPKNEKQQEQVPGQMPKWKRDSLVFSANIKRNKGQQLTPQQQQVLRYVECRFCNKLINKEVMKKHIATCDKRTKKQ